MELSTDRQVEVMMKQLGAFDDIMEKLYYMANFFDPDPDFTQEARDIVRGEVSKSLKPES